MPNATLCRANAYLVWMALLCSLIIRGNAQCDSLPTAVQPDIPNIVGVGTTGDCVSNPAFTVEEVDGVSFVY